MNKYLKYFIFIFVFLLNINYVVAYDPFNYDLSPEAIEKYKEAHVRLVRNYKSEYGGKQPIGIFFYPFPYSPYSLNWGLVYNTSDIPRLEFDTDTNGYRISSNTKLASSVPLIPNNNSNYLLHSFKPELAAKMKYFSFDGFFENPKEIDFRNGSSSGGDPTSPSTGDTGTAGLLDKLGNMVDSILGGFNSLLSAITDASKKIINGILEGLEVLLKKLFVPSNDYFTTRFNYLKEKLFSKFGFDYVESMLIQFKNAKPSAFNDIYFKDMKILDMSFINQSLPKIKKYTDGFFWFLLFMYNVDSIHFLIRGNKLFRETNIFLLGSKSHN